MRASPSELQAVRRGGLLTRYAILDGVAFAHADLPAAGTAGTGLDEPCEQEHHAFVVRGALILQTDSGDERFDAGTAFYVPAGRRHTFASEGPTVVAGFTKVEPDLDVSPPALRAQGFEIVRAAPPPLIPGTIEIADSARPVRRRGSIDVEAAEMGPWLFTRATFKAGSGYASVWCDLPHWGMVLDGVLALQTETGVELLAAGDAFSVPAGPPGHRFEAPEPATLIDYTPIAALGTTGRIQSWRRATISRVLGPAAETSLVEPDREAIARTPRGLGAERPVRLGTRLRLGGAPA